MLRRLLSSALALIFATTLAAQERVVLVADNVLLNGRNQLIARGNVEAVSGDTTLQAAQITYDRGSDTIVVEGPIRITQGDSVSLVADFAELDADLQNGMLHSARMVLDQQVQLAAVQMSRVNGRYNQLYKTAVTSCQVCNSDEPPLWQIRARRVIHDQEERQLYFDDAQLLIFDVPVFYIPHLRLPDPTLERATGFLTPSLVNDSRLGLGVKLPYFLRLGDHKDLTLTPYLSSNTRTLELQYRQAWKSGGIVLDGAISDDDLLPGNVRGYLFAQGAFDLKRDYRLSFDAKAVTDASYLSDYNFADYDRLESDITLSRARRDELVKLALHHFETLRPTESNNTIPALVAEASLEKRYFPTRLGGEARMSLSAHGHYRYSDLPIDGTDVDNIVDGRDVGRASAEFYWERSWILNSGLQATAKSQLALDAFNTTQDTTRAGFVTDVVPSTAVALRWPMVRYGSSGTTDIVEPVAQIAWTGGSVKTVANDESTRVEFDEGNLLALSRFPTADRRERGLVAAVGLNWTRYSNAGWQGTLSLGQVIRQDNMTDFTTSSGLSGTRSDFLVAGQLKLRNGLSLTSRGLFDAVNGVNKVEARAGWTGTRINLDASYVWLGADAAEDRANTLSEWTLDGSYRLGRHWTALADWQYDIASDSTTQAGIGLQYRNECVKLDFGASRSFTSSTTVQPSTEYSLTIALLGFTTASDKSYTRNCNATSG